LEINYEVKTTPDKEHNLVLVFPTFHLQAFDANKINKEPHLSIECTFLLIYKATTLEKLENDNFEAFGKTNGIYNAWPYWREFVQNMIARMALPPLTIPVFRLTKPKQS
jgi:preprotein translocase subunit SecB